MIRDLFFAALLTLAPCAASADQKGDCGTIVIPTGVGVSSSADITSFNPMLVQSLYNQQAAGLLFESLIWVNQHHQIDWSRSIASAITTPDQGTTYIVTMRPWHWSDGLPVTADDVAYTFDLIKKLGTTYPQYGTGDMPEIVKSFMVIDASHFKVILKRQVNSLWYIYNGIGLLSPMPKHIWSKYTVDQLWQNQSTPAFFDVVDGPLKVTKLDVGLDAVFVPNPKYEGQPLHFQRLIWRFLDNDGAELQGVESGDLDLANLPNALWKSAQNVPGVYNVPLPPPASWNYLQLNFRNPHVAFFNDVRVRQAMQDASDQRDMVNLAFNGLGVEDYGPVPPSPPDFLSPAMKAGHYPVGYDPAKARALLKEAGYTPGPDGIMEKAGQRLSFTDLMLTGDATIEQMTEILQGQLRAVGIEMKVHEIEFNQMLALLNGFPQRWEAAGLGMTLGAYPSGESLFSTGGAFNSGGYSDKTMDKLIDASINKPGLDGLYAYEDYTSAQAPVLFMATGRNVIMARDRIQGVAEFTDPSANIYPDALYCKTGKVAEK